MPYVLYRIEVGRFCTGFPPVYHVINNEVLSEIGGVFRIIILHEAMSDWKFLLDEGNKCLVQDLCKQESVHNAFKNADSCRPFLEIPAHT